ncbi:MAG TPA: hypothetical protein DCO65_00170 [Spartobacteria bacterium]|nr:hypothetical protein [Spartobacteria bacterium]
MAREERQIFALRELENELVRSKAAVDSAMKQSVNEGIAVLLERLVDYGVARRHIRKNEWQPRMAALQATGRSKKKHSRRPRQRNKIKRKPRSQQRS